jgi:hypothetical protein
MKLLYEHFQDHPDLLFEDLWPSKYDLYLTLVTDHFRRVPYWCISAPSQKWPSKDDAQVAAKIKR